MELKKLLSEELESKLNKQVGVEFTAAHTYRSMASWADKYGYLGVQKYFLKQLNEEYGHGQKVLDYIVDRNACPCIPSLPMMMCNYTSMEDVLAKYMEAELLVEETWKQTSMKAKVDKDETTYVFSIWYLNEQISEIATVGDLIAQYNMFVQGGTVSYACGEIDKIMNKLAKG